MVCHSKTDHGIYVRMQVIWEAISGEEAMDIHELPPHLVVAVWEGNSGLFRRKDGQLDIALGTEDKARQIEILKEQVISKHNALSTITDAPGRNFDDVDAMAQSFVQMKRELDAIILKFYNGETLTMKDHLSICQWAGITMGVFSERAKRR